MPRWTLGALGHLDSRGGPEPVRNQPCTATRSPLPTRPFVQVCGQGIALRHGLNAVFMAKDGGPVGQLHAPAPERGDMASGQNIFSNADGSASERFLHYIGGLQTYTPT